MSSASFSRRPIRRPQQSFGRYGTPRTNARPARRNNYSATIHPGRFVNQAVASRSAIVPPVIEHRFTDFGLAAPLLKNILAHGYSTPTPIQDQAMPLVMDGRDVIGLANTGTGKTAAFMLPILHRLLNDSQAAALIVAPTRELAAQIADETRLFSRNLPLHLALCVGGMSMSRQRQALAARPRLVIGTPGRLKDLLQQGVLRLQQTNLVVLDEADRMLDMGFIRDIRTIIAELPRVRQSLCFSATMTPGINQLIQELLDNPVTVSVKTHETAEHIDQDVIVAGSPDEKLAVLSGLLNQPEFAKVLIFGQTKHGVQRLAERLSKQGISTEAIHGNKSQPQRQRSLQAFKNNHVRVLVATDVAARGLDIPNVSHVINFDQPNTYDDYVHRIGRTGRAGQAGKALTFVASR